MCIDGPHPRLRVVAQFNASLRSLGLWPYTYYAACAIRLVRGAGASRVVSPLLPMRLDTGAFVSALPERWAPALAGFLQLTGPAYRFATAAGPGTGRMAGGVRVRFSDDPCEEPVFDFLVTSGLDPHNYGLLSLRDILNYFEVHSSGDVVFDAARRPTALPILELVPRHATS